MALSQTRQLPLEVTRSISHQAFLRRYRSTRSGTSVIFIARATVKLHRLRGAGHSPVVPVIALQATRVMGPATRRTLRPSPPRSVNEICDLSLTVSPPCYTMSSPTRHQAPQTGPELVHKTFQVVERCSFCFFQVFGLPHPSVWYTEFTVLVAPYSRSSVFSI